MVMLTLVNWLANLISALGFSVTITATVTVTINKTVQQLYIT